MHLRHKRAAKLPEPLDFFHLIENREARVAELPGGPELEGAESGRTREAAGEEGALLVGGQPSPDVPFFGKVSL
ncbi:MAG: hypothetical protein QW379_04490 [Thermoplasmata archaeon]